MRINLSKFILDLLFPHTCCGCDIVGPLLCSNCWQKLDWQLWPVKLELNKTFLDQVSAAFEYTPLTKSIVRRCKYDQVQDAAVLMAELISNYLPPRPNHTLCPVPLHYKRQSQRGFNQAQTIGNTLAQIWQLPSQNLLIRTVNSSQQVKQIDKNSRLHHLDHHFALNPIFKDNLPSRVTLIDDVVTTGTTLNQCAQILKQNGVKQVNAITFAHGV